MGDPCVPLMEAQRAADCVGERIESTKQWRVQEIVHTPGSFSSLALQCHARGLNLKGINRRKYYLRGIGIKHGRGCKNGRPPTVGRDMCPVHFVETLHGLVAVVLSALQQVMHGHGAAVVVDVALAVGEDLDALDEAGGVGRGRGQRVGAVRVPGWTRGR